MSLSKGLLAIAMDFIGPIPDFRYQNTLPIRRRGETMCVAETDDAADHQTVISDYVFVKTNEN